MTRGGRTDTGGRPGRVRASLARSLAMETSVVGVSRLAGAAALVAAAAVAGCAGAPTDAGADGVRKESSLVDWTGIALDLVEDTPYRTAFDPGERVREGRLDSVTVPAGAEVIRSVELTSGQLVILPAPGAHGAFTIRAHVEGASGVATSDRRGRVEPRTDVSVERLVRATVDGVTPAPGSLRVEALGDGRTLGGAPADGDGRSPAFQLSRNQTFLVLRGITVVGGDTSMVRRVRLEVEPGEDVALDSLATEAPPPGWTRSAFRRYLCDAEDADGDRWHGVTMWEPASLDCRIRRGDYDRVVLMQRTPLVVDGRPVGTLDEAERAFVADQIADPEDGVAILGARLPVEVMGPDAPRDAWQVVESGGAVYLRPTRPGTLLVYVDRFLSRSASLAWDTDGDDDLDTGFVVIGYQPRTDFAHADFTVSHELMRHAGLVGLASRDFLDRTLMSFYTPQAPTDPTTVDLHAAAAMRRHPPGVPADDVFGLVF